MITVREAIEQAIVLSIGAASLTRERVEGIVADFVRRGALGAEEGKAVVDKVMSRVRGDGAAAAGVAGKFQGGVQSLLKELDIARRAEVADLEMRIAAVEHRLRLVEGDVVTDADAPPDPPDEG
jgi:polyhydroxyalkanoate synthesis regulator phasin